MASNWSCRGLNSSLPLITSDKSPKVPSRLSGTIVTFYSSYYQRSSLLGLPSEVRDEIWQAIFDDIADSKANSTWAQRPLTGYEGLSLTCHRIHHETAFFWPRTIIQHNRIAVFAQFSRMNLKLRDFKCLTLEIPMNEKIEFFLIAAETLKGLSRVLQDLRIFFVGSDKHQVLLTLNPCGLHTHSMSFKKLTIDGQRHSVRQPLFAALRHLSNLHSLVVSNPNYPVFTKMVLENKPRLKRLHLVADARSTVHRCHDLGSGGLINAIIRPLQDGLPPVDTLVLSANASLNSLQLAAACTSYLRHLTWIVPDFAMQSAGGISVNWYRDTATLLQTLRMGSPELHSLRICIHGVIYEADAASRMLSPAFRDHLKHLPIETLELHIKSCSPWFGQEILRDLPDSVRRLYLTKELLDEKYLTHFIDRRYLAYRATCDDWLNSRFVVGLKGFAQADKLIIAGEDSSRDDYISLKGGRLGFVGFEYEPGQPTMFVDSVMRQTAAEDTKIWMLTLNARLLDRERNAHLAAYAGGDHIPLQQPDSLTSGGTTAETDSIACTYGPLWVYAPPSVRELKTAAAELQDSILTTIPHSYFGREEEAVKVFQHEESIHPDDVLERRWPDEVTPCENEHWQSDCQYSTACEDVQMPWVKELQEKAQTSHSAWGEERVAHWIHNWTWYSRDHSFLKYEEREAFLVERTGDGLQSLESVERKS